MGARRARGEAGVVDVGGERRRAGGRESKEPDGGAPRAGAAAYSERMGYFGVRARGEGNGVGSGSRRGRRQG